MWRGLANAQVSGWHVRVAVGSRNAAKLAHEGREVQNRVDLRLTTGPRHGKDRKNTEEAQVKQNDAAQVKQNGPTKGREEAHVHVLLVV